MILADLDLGQIEGYLRKTEHRLRRTDATRPKEDHFRLTAVIIGSTKGLLRPAEGLSDRQRKRES